MSDAARGGGERAGAADIVPGAALAGVAMGLSTDELVRLLGAPQDVSEFPEDGALYYSYRSLGLSFLFERGVLTTGFAYSGRQGGYETGEFARYGGATPEGIDVDATYADVLRIYGPPTTRGELSLAPVPSLWIDYDDRGVAFDFITETGEMILLKVSRPGGRDGSSEAT